MYARERRMSHFVAMMILVIGSAANALAAEKIVIAGDPCTVPVAQKLGEAFTAETGVEVEVRQGSCRSGVSNVVDGKADIGVSTFNFGQGQLPTTLHKVVIGKAPIIFVVNKDNQIDSITREQAEGIMSGAIRNWKEVGGNDLPIENVYLQPCVLETMAHETNATGKVDGLRKIVPAKKGNPMTGTNMIVSKNKGAIGLQLYGYESDTVKVLKIDGVLPAPENLPGAYSYYEDFNIITGSAPAGAIKEFIEFTLGEEGKAILLSWKHIPENRG